MAISTAVSSLYTPELMAAAEELKKVTPQDYLDMTVYTKNLEDETQRLKAELAAKSQVQVYPAKDYPAHAWTKFTHPGEREEISMGTKGDTMQDVIDDFMVGVEYARSKGLVIVGVNTIKPSAAQTQSQLPTGSDIPDVPAGATDNTPVGFPSPESAPPVGQEPYVPGLVYQFTCYRLRITQEAGTKAGKAKIEFFTNAFRSPIDEFPFLTAYDTPANFAKKFVAVGPWKEAHFQSPYDQVLQKPFNVDWTYSEKTNSKGNHYRNLVGVEPIV